MQISDDLFLGSAYAGANAPGYAYQGDSMELGIGPLGRIFCFDTVPVTLQAAGLATSQNPGSAAGFTLTAGTGVTARLRPEGVTEYVLDVPRCVTITAAGANTATYTVTGYDQYGQKMTQTLSAPSTSTVATLKAFKTVISVVNANATAGTNGLTVGFNDTLGLPFRLTDLGYVTNCMFNQAAVTINSTNIKVADQTATATASTGDVRGTVAFGVSDGIKRGIMGIMFPAIACGPNATRIGAYGVNQA